MTIYISLPITGHDIEKVTKAANHASALIRARGHHAVNPLEITHRDMSYAQCLDKDIETIIGQCDAIFLQPGWRASKGCTLEYQCALLYDKEIYYPFDEIPEKIEK